MEDPASVGIRFLLYLDLMLLFGLSMFGLYGLHGPERSDRSILKLRFGLVLLAVLGIFLSAVALFLLTASMAGLPLTEVDAESVTMLLSGTSAGAAWTARVVALAIAFLLPLLVWRRPFSALTGTSAAGATALGTLAWAGHGAAMARPMSHSQRHMAESLGRKLLDTLHDYVPNSVHQYLRS